MKPISALWRHGLLFVPLAFLLLFYVYPLLAIFQVSLAPEGQINLASFIETATSRYYQDTLSFTCWQALLSTAVTIGLALPGAYVFTRYSFPGKDTLLSLSVLSFVLPTVVVAAAFGSLIGPRGLFNSVLMSVFHLDAPPIQLERTLAIILIAHVFYNYPLALRMISGFWANQSYRLEETARVLGASGWRMWLRVRLPLLRPILTASTVLVFMFTFTSFGVILILGGPRFATLEVEIYRQTTSLFNLPVAAALSLVQIGAMLALIVFYTGLQRRVTVPVQQQTRTARPAQNGKEKALVLVNAIVVVGLLFVPLMALVLQSLRSDDLGLSLRFYRQLTTNTRESILFVPPMEAIWNSVLFAIVTMLMALALGLIITTYLARRQSRLGTLLDPLFMLPLATSAVTLGFGYIIALDRPPLNLRTSPALIPLAHTLVALPFVVRSVLPALRRIPPNLRESARVLGAPSWQVWRLIDLPLIRRSLIVGATFAFTISMGEFGATAFIARPETPTMPVVIYRLLGQPGAANYGQALAMSVILMGVCGLSFIIIERLRTTGLGEF